MGTASAVPWVSVFPPGADSAQVDYYLVYLFAATGERVYLSLIQGTDKVRGGLPPLIKRSLDLRAAAGDAPDLLTTIDLASNAQRPRRYQAATAYATVYEAESVPDTADLRRDMLRFVGLLDTAVGSGLRFDPEIEPLHVLLKWSSERNSATVENHRAVAEQHGSVWWGAFRAADSPAPMSTETLSTIRDQLNRGMTTHAYLYGGSELWRCQLEEITLDETEVDEERLPSYYTKADCRLFARLSHFDQIAIETATEQLVLARNPGSTSIGPALSNQTTPMLVYELFRPIANPDPPPIDQFDLEWLLKETLWQREPLEELIHAARETSPQIVLAGPPGTGKTWVAQALVKHLTGGSPLGYEIVQFHPSYGYEEFIEGIRPTVSDSGHIEFERVDGIVLKIVKSLSDVGGDFYLIIDEMNRANLSRVFGELMYLFEYRDQPINLRYTPAFELPENLKFIGTMNTADRSIRSIDIALRRRFDVFECAPDRGILERYYQDRTNEVAGLFDGFDALNAELERRLDRHHTIGQTFFMRKEGMTAQWLRQVWARKLGPLIEEYFFDQPDVVEQFTPQAFWSELDGSSTDAD